MAPMELELFHHMKNVIGVSPTFYEFVLMVDADTEVLPDALNRMISLMVDDSKIMGLCGETAISNEKNTWVTMIQVYEYFISHHLAKSFESLFGTVTCLPGCFCMYRMRSAVKNVPLLVSNGVLADYSENNVNTLHTKNLLHLGEDRYLTTLMLKHFPMMRTSFYQEAKCLTSAPDRWSVLLSQRRRWINSTVHNLIELTTLSQLCGFCCFSMRFIVMLDLFATFVQPATVLYVLYLIISVSLGAEEFPLLSLILIAAVYGLQIFIFLIKREWQHIIWMLIYLLAMPIFSFWIPVYSFWHFDDFSWGNTRVVVGEGKKTVYVADAEPFDPTSIPLKSWKDHEPIASEEWEKGSVVSGGLEKENPPGYAASEAGGSVYSGYAPSVQMQQQQQMNMNMNRMSMMSMMQPMSSQFSPYAMPANPNFSSPYNRNSAFINPSLSPKPQSVPVVRTSSNGGGASNASAAANGEIPSDEVLLAEIRDILSTADLMTITKKQVREMLSARLGGVDLKPKREVINKMIDNILKGY
jgi:chitin synthase